MYQIRVKKHEDAKLPTIFLYDEEMDSDFENDSDYLESGQALERGKYPFLQNHPL